MNCLLNKVIEQRR